MSEQTNHRDSAEIESRTSAIIEILWDAADHHDAAQRIVDLLDPDYPHADGSVLVLGPQSFVSKDGAVLNWQGRNYVPQ
jgi:hypothetical protein